MGPFHITTPLLESAPLTHALGAPVFLKLEALQPAGSFKIRGIGRFCQEAAGSGTTHLVSSSGGNAGYAVAYAGRKLGVKVTVVVPITTPPWMRERIQSEGATVLEHGAAWDDAHAHAVTLAKEARTAYVHPFDHPTLWAGHATLIEEAASQMEKPGAVVAAVGGGGLLCGVLQGLRDAGWDDIPVIAVETEGADSFAAAVRAGRLVTLERIASVATSLGARRVAAEALAWTKRHEIFPWTVTDRSAVRACLRFADDHRVLVEPACGAALAAAYERAEPLQKRSSALVIVCGGAGVALDRLRAWAEQVGA